MAIATHLPAGLKGLSIIGGVTTTATGNTYEKVSPIDGVVLGDVTLATPEQVEEALAAAWRAHWQDNVILPSDRLRRAAMLEAVAAKLTERKEELRITYGLESALPTVKDGRFDIEFNRTVAQLRFHAKRLSDHSHFVPVINIGTPFGILSKTMQGIGPVLVLGAINFPLAFSTAGGDFADAWASGCPVIMRAHSEHPFTSEIVASCIVSALKELGVDQGWFTLLHCERELTLKMVADDRVKAVAITGSLSAAMAIKAVADKHMKPVYAECGSINPVFVLSDMLASDTAKVATDYVGSVTSGAGQFCTCPGLLIAVDGPGFADLTSQVSVAINAKPAVAMLSARTKTDFKASVAKLLAIPGMSVLAGGEDVNHATQTKPVILTISAVDFLANSAACQHEAFGQCSIIVKASNMNQVFAIATSLTGNLTATRYGTEDELVGNDGMKLLRILQTKAGRHISNCMPTGVAVCNAVTHGGPFPACTINSSSVGGSLRFMSEVCHQGEPDSSLPLELQAANPLGITRLVNGIFTASSLNCFA